MHSGCRGTAVPDVCLRAFSLFPSPQFPARPKACSQPRLQLDLDNIPRLYMQISVGLPSKKNDD